MSTSTCAQDSTISPSAPMTRLVGRDGSAATRGDLILPPSAITAAGGEPIPSTGKPACDCCSTTDWRDAHVIGGRLLCSRCWADLARPMGNGPSGQLALDLEHAAQREGACRG
jgi:hypothetical protein